QRLDVAGQQLQVQVAVVVAATDADVLVDPEPEVAAGNPRQVLAQAVDHLAAGDPAFGQRLHLHHHETVVHAGTAADVAGDVGDRRIRHQVFAVGLDLRLHHLERQAVV